MTLGLAKTDFTLIGCISKLSTVFQLFCQLDRGLYAKPLYCVHYLSL
jgi:hypothetical protein